MIVNELINNRMNSPIRRINGAVELYNSTALLDTYTKDGDLQEFTIERTGEGKFFGYGIAHKANIKIRDVDRTKKILANNGVCFTFESIKLFPELFISEVHRNENTNQLSLTAYDKLEQANKISFSVLQVQEELPLQELINKIIEVLQLNGFKAINITDDSLTTVYKMNYDEGDTLRKILNEAAEVTQSIYYIDNEDRLVFRRLNTPDEPIYPIGKERYFTLKAKDNKRLQTIAKATELGDNVSKSTEHIGSTQYIRNNSLWELREDIPALLDKAIAAVGDLRIAQYEMEWRGNPLVELGDKIKITTKDNKFLGSYLLSDTLKYDGTLSQKSEWKFEEEEETDTNPSTIGDILNQTFARVDKQNKEIELAVKRIEKNEGSISDLENSVNLKIDEEKLKIEVSKQIKENSKSIETGKGFTFDDSGLNITSTEEGVVNPISTNINENGMKIKQGNDVVLTANNAGVDAKNLHATTYLIVGNNSRFEDYQTVRTGCFYVG